MPLNKESIINLYIDKLKGIYGNSLRKVILYGSYARGDYRPDSDIDIMILIDEPRENIVNYLEALSRTTFDFFLEYNLDIQPVVQNIDFFDKWVSVYPFYANIQKEGVRLYAA